MEMTLLCEIEVTHPPVLGSREVRRGGVRRAEGVQPSWRAIAGSPGGLRVSDACVLIGLQRVRCFVCCAASSRTVPRACFPSAEAGPATTGYPL